MSFEVIMPKMGESIVEGTIVEWKKNVGDFVEKDEILLEISTDKVDSEIPSPSSGTIIEILAKVNDTVPIGDVIARIGEDTEILDSKQMRLIATGKNYSIFFKMIQINTYISIFNFAQSSLEISI